MAKMSVFENAAVFMDFILPIWHRELLFEKYNAKTLLDVSNKFSVSLVHVKCRVAFAMGNNKAYSADYFFLQDIISSTFLYS